jgi:poly-beta-1,6-N-acetyl-D-glucosamine synthase
MRTAADVILAFVALYPIVTAAIWIAGGLVFSVAQERRAPALPSTEGLPRVSILIPAYNEEADIAAAVRAALAVDYPDFEVIVLDDGSTDATAERARLAGGGDDRLSVIAEGQNRGKAATLNLGALAATGAYLVMQDADATLHPLALRALVASLEPNPRVAAVAGDPRVTNRGSLLAELQTLEFAAIIGLIRRTEAVGARVGVVAGVIGIFRREAFRAVGGFDRRMATEDIELTYRLLLAGWYTAYEPRALVGMRVPTSLRALWRQRRRWARGQGEVLHVHGPTLARWRNRHLWSVFAEPLVSLAWVVLFALIAVTTITRMALGDVPPILTYLPEWGVAVGAITTIQFCSALLIERRYDRDAPTALLLGPLYPACYWLVNALAALTSELPAICFGPRETPVHWDTGRISAPDLDPADGQGVPGREHEAARLPHERA